VVPPRPRPGRGALVPTRPSGGRTSRLADLEVVSDTLGHWSIMVTADVYAQLLEPAKAEAAEAMTAVLWSRCS
jgi:hypothetical protein